MAERHRRKGQAPQKEQKDDWSHLYEKLKAKRGTWTQCKAISSQSTWYTDKHADKTLTHLKLKQNNNNKNLPKLLTAVTKCLTKVS